MRKLCIVLITLSILALVGVCSAANWQTVTTFTGSASKTTDYFTIPTNEWRINWKCTPTSPRYEGIVAITVYAKGGEYIKAFSSTNTETSGITYIHEGTGQYYLDISPIVANFEITVEYDSSAIPEFSTIAVIIAIALVSISVIAIRNKVKN